MPVTLLYRDNLCGNFCSWLLPLSWSLHKVHGFSNFGEYKNQLEDVVKFQIPGGNFRVSHAKGQETELLTSTSNKFRWAVQEPGFAFSLAFQYHIC